MATRGDWVWRSGDAFLPSWITSILYRPILKFWLVEINGWSLVHFLSGVLAGLVGMTWNWLIFAHTSWELWQIAIGMSDISKPAEWIDITFDSLFAFAGYWAVL